MTLTNKLTVFLVAATITEHIDQPLLVEYKLSIF